MIQLQGYNVEEEKYVTLMITDDGVVLGKENWNHIRSGSVKRFTEKCDTDGNLLYEDDEIISILNGLKMTIRYGEYEAFCPGDQCPMANIGFYVEAEGYSNMPLGEPDMYAKLVCHNNQGKEFEKLEAKRTAILLPDENCIYKLSKALAESKSCPCDVGLADSAYCDEGWCKECWKNALSPEL